MHTDKVTELFVFRHGETDWNVERRFQGHTDIPLNALGRQQAAELRGIFEKCRPEILLTSDLMRAKVTAEIVNQNLRLPMFESRALRESMLGDPEGMHRDKVIEKYGMATCERWFSVKPEDLEFCFPNGEPKSQHLARTLQYLQTFCLENADIARIGVSTHGGSLMRLVHHCAGAPIERIAIPNCVLYKVSFRHSDSQWVYCGRVE